MYIPPLTDASGIMIGKAERERISLTELKVFEEWLDQNYHVNPHYYHVKEALEHYRSSIGSQEEPGIMDALLITHSGLLVASAFGSGRMHTDMHIFSAMLSAITAFVKDTLMEWPADTDMEMAYGNRRIYMTAGEYTYIALVTEGHANPIICQRAARILKEVEKRYGSFLARWRGDRDMFTGLDVYIRKYLMGRDRRTGSPGSGKGVMQDGIEGKEDNRSGH